MGIRSVSKIKSLFAALDFAGNEGKIDVLLCGIKRSFVGSMLSFLRCCLSGLDYLKPYAWSGYERGPCGHRGSELGAGFPSLGIASLEQINLNLLRPNLDLESVIKYRTL